MPDQFQAVSDAFDRKADLYDAFTQRNPHLQWLRNRVYDHVQSVVPVGAHILELNAGTGEDAVALIERGYRVHATDLAPAMITKIADKQANLLAQGTLTYQQCSFVSLHEVEGVYDAAFSNSGGLNCVPSLKPVASGLEQKIRVGGTATMVIMPPFYPWELATAVKDWRVGTRRFAGERGAESRVEGVAMTTYYFTPQRVKQWFGENWSEVRLQSLNLFSPNADNYTFMQKAPRIYNTLKKMDIALGDTPPFNRWGDFFILTLSRDR